MITTSPKAIQKQYIMIVCQLISYDKVFFHCFNGVYLLSFIDDAYRMERDVCSKNDVPCRGLKRLFVVLALSH